MEKIIFTTLIFFLLMEDDIFSQNKAEIPTAERDTEIIIYSWEALETHKKLKKEVFGKNRKGILYPYLKEMCKDAERIEKTKSWQNKEYVDYMMGINLMSTQDDMFESMKADVSGAVRDTKEYLGMLEEGKKIGAKTEFLHYFLDWKNTLGFKDVWMLYRNKPMFTFEFWEELDKKVPELRAIVQSFTDLYDIAEDLYYPDMDILNQFQTINEKGVKVLTPKILAIKETNYPKELEMLQKIFRLAQEGKGRIFLLHPW